MCAVSRIIVADDLLSSLKHFYVWIDLWKYLRNTYENTRLS